MAALLKEIATLEVAALARESVSHRPTVGDMYEGLTRSLLERVIPDSLDLRVVSGFATGPADERTAQLDVMIVRGEGRRIPYTDSFEYPVKDVIAVVQVKKHLYSRDLLEGLSNLMSVKECYGRYIATGAKAGGRAAMIMQAFQLMTGHPPPGREEISRLEPNLELLYHTLVLEHFGPLRVLWGYDGFKSEANFREGMWRILDRHVGQRGWGVHSFPQLLVAGNYSLAKLNGYPYAPRLEEGGWWPFLASSRENPMLLLLEYLWTRLESYCVLQGAWDVDSPGETMTPFLSGRHARGPSGPGWEYRCETLQSSLTYVGNVDLAE